MSSAEFSSQKYTSHLIDKEADADRLEQESQKEENIEKAHEAEEIRDQVSQTREGARKAGVSLEQIYVLKGGDEVGALATGMYERKLGALGRTGMTSMENFQKISKDHKGIARQVENTLLHEWKGHRQAHKNSIAKGNDGKLQSSLGPDLAEAIDEENAMRQERGSNPESGKPADYARYRRDTRQVSAELRVDVAELLAKGDDDKIVEKTQENEQKKAQNTAGKILIFPRQITIARAA